MTWYADTAAVMGLVGLFSGLGVPTLIGWIPEPESDHDEIDEADAAVPDDLDEGPDDVPSADSVVEEPKELYLSIASIPGLRGRAALACAVIGALVGARLGWDWALLPVMYLVPIGVALALVDWRTRLLPTKVIAPSYAAVVLLAVVAALAAGDWSDLVRAGWGWAVAGGTYLLLWVIYPRGMGYGDVRLSGVLGIVLGFLGWGPLVLGIWVGFFLGGVGGLVLSALRITDRKAYPFGPFMLLGALVGVLWGQNLTAYYLGR